MAEHGDTATTDEARFAAQAAPLLGEPSARASAEFSLMLADALANPVVRILLIELVREALRTERTAEIAGAIAEAEAQRARAIPTPPKRGSDRTSWVGRRYAAEQARQAQSQESNQ